MVAVRPGPRTRPPPRPRRAWPATHGFTLVHYSSEYVFDGTAEEHTEDEPVSPLGVYAQSKAAGDIAVGLAPRHYLVRTSWVIGDGKNFVRTMADLAAKGVSPSVVSDRVGRLTFASELSRATKHLIDSNASFGTYNMSNSGAAMSWAEIAREVFTRSGRSGDDVSETTTEAYAAGVLEKGNPFAPARCSQRCRSPRSAPPGSSPRTRSSLSTATSPDPRFYVTGVYLN
ncbi:SDR family oxidoreductase [Nocardioides sp. B-3]|uniref:SDR family oxidoreductase n=1 Tax=Nocardioides sp. B-3 TaxID=2895565 RepID=UPI002152F8EE|nr:sugar nucleotide-binding protein [Nocardioides sp. B-3]